MKRRILMVSAMILLLGSQVDLSAKKRVEPERRRPGIEMRDDRKPGRPMTRKAIRKGDIKRVQDFYWMKYRIRLSKKEAEKIIMEDMKDRRARHDLGPRKPQRPQRR